MASRRGSTTPTATASRTSPATSTATAPSTSAAPRPCTWWAARWAASSAATWAGSSRRSRPSSPSSAAAGSSDIGTRSSLGGVRDAMVLRMMAPLVLLRDGAVFEAVPDLVEYQEVKVGTLTKTPKPGSIAVLKNLTSGEWRCARVQANGHLRVAVPSDKGNQLELSFYEGELKTQERDGLHPRGRAGRARLCLRRRREVPGRDVRGGQSLRRGERWLRPAARQPRAAAHAGPGAGGARGRRPGEHRALHARRANAHLRHRRDGLDARVLHQHHGRPGRAHGVGRDDVARRAGW